MLKNRIKQAMALLLALVLIVGGIAFDPAQAVAAATKTIKAGDAYYTILPAGNKTAEYAKPAKKSCTSADIPDTVKISGKTYKVTDIAANAFKGCNKLKKVTIGKNVSKVGKQAFYGCKNLKSVKINTTKLTAKNVGSKAFAKLHAKAVVTVPESKLVAYKKILKAKGLTGTQQKVKVVKENGGSAGDQDKYLTFDENHPLPAPASAGFTIGDYSSKGAPVIETKPVVDTTKYTAGDTISFTAGLDLEPEIYGTWGTKPGSGIFYQCGPCGKFFSTEAMLIIHRCMSDYCSGGNYIFAEDWPSFTDNYYIQDSAPCKVIYRFTLPQGLSYRDGSLKVVNFLTGEIDSKYYHAEISGSQIVVTVDNIKEKPFYVPLNEKKYEEKTWAYHDFMEDGETFRSSINVTFDTEMNSHTGTDNQVSSSITYYYKDAQKTVDLGTASVHAASLQIKNTDEDGNSLKGAAFDLYKKKATFKEGSNLAVLNWEKIASGLTTESIVTGLGTGFMKGENQYRIVQTSAPAGYEEAGYSEFVLAIDAKGSSTMVSANKKKGGSVSVNGTTVCVNVINVADDTGAGNTTVSKDTGATQNPPSKTDEENTVETPSAVDEGCVRVKAVYYQDGVQSFTMNFQQDVKGGMMDAFNVSDCADDFKGCTLQKITVDGVAVDSLPAKIKDGSEVCFYYSN